MRGLNLASQKSGCGMRLSNLPSFFVSSRRRRERASEMRPSNLPSLLFAMVVACLILHSAARADNLIVTLFSPVVGAPGSTLSIVGTIVAPSTNSGSVYLNSDSLSLAGPFTLNDDPFILNAPTSMAPGATYTAVLFTVTISPQASEGIYTGFFTILGGESGDPLALDPISNTASFEVHVVPEPTAMLLVGTGLIGIMLRVRRRR